MGKSIKVSNEMYVALIEMQRPRETFSEEIERLLRVYQTLFGVKETLGPSHFLAERPSPEVSK